MRRRPTEQEIAARAHELHEQRGAAHGRALDDWLQAEAELEAAETSAESTEVQRRPQSASKGRTSRTSRPIGTKRKSRKT
jgi:hypothetical protein